jgi:outer membrane receptor protein involved in Fe transport
MLSYGRRNAVLRCLLAAACCLALASSSSADVPGAVAGTIRDTSGLPLPGVTVAITGAGGGARSDTTTDVQGRYSLMAARSGEYDLDATLPGFQPSHLHVRVGAGQRLVVDVRMKIAGVAQNVTVRGDVSDAPPVSRVLVTRTDLDHIPGALQAGSLCVITELSPSAVVAHDQVHVRGGHQVGYEIDGVEVPSTSVTSNLALLFDPKEADAIDFQRGAYSAEYGDRLYGVLDVVTKSGFDRARGGESMVIAAQQRDVEGAAAYGDHADKLAWFAQVAGNRTDLGLTPPSLPAVHDRTWGAGGAARVWASRGTDRLLTMTGSVRADDFAIPRLPQDEGVDDNQAERDVYFHAQWNHTGARHAVWSVTPYYHFNEVALNPGVVPDAPSSSELLASDDRRIHYLGMKADWSGSFGRHMIKVGGDSYAGFLRDGFLLPSVGARHTVPLPPGQADTAQGQSPLADSVGKAGINSSAFVEDVYQPAGQLTTSLGLRWDRSQAWQTESGLQPRIGLQARVPSTPLTVHAYVGRFFQVPPLEALGPGGAQFAALGDQAFLLVRAERDTQWETGIALPAAGGTLDLTYYDTHATNFLDHEQLGDSSVFLPVNIAQARLRGLEVSASSAPGRRVRARLVYSHSYAQGRGGVTGGLGDIEPRAAGGYYFLDHDERNSAVASLDWTISSGAWAHVSVAYGSGFLRADGPQHLPWHVTGDLAAGFSFARRWSAAVDVLNVTDRRYFVNLSSEFNGTHVARPRTVAMRLCARF